MDLDSIETSWNQEVDRVFSEAMLERPQISFTRGGGRQGVHSEHMGFLLAEMQSLQRAHPGLIW